MFVFVPIPGEEKWFALLRTDYAIGTIQVVRIVDAEEKARIDADHITEDDYPIVQLDQLLLRLGEVPVIL